MTKLIICIDGLGKDFINKTDTPFLYEFGKNNHFSELKTLFAFTGLEYSFFKGESPLEHKIWFEFINSKTSIFNDWILRVLSFNKKLRNYFGAFVQLLNKRTYICGTHNIPKDKLKYFDTSVKYGLWNTDYFKNKSFAFYKWPFLITKDKKAKIIFKYENDNERIKRLLKIKGVDIYYTQLMEVDKIIHKYGKESKETKETLKRVDKIIKKYTKQFLKENHNREVFIWSDHGFADIKNYINLKEILPKQNNYIYFIAGTTAHFWFENKQIKKEILKKIKNIKEIEILDKKKADKFQIPLDKKYGDLVIFIKKGNYFFPNFYQSDKEFKAMHGYPDDKELNGFLISNKKIPKKLKIEEVIHHLK